MKVGPAEQKIVYLSLFGAFVVLTVALFAVQNEGWLKSSVYTNNLLGYNLEIPSGYHLGTVYMKYLDTISNSAIRLNNSDTFIENEAEIVVLTTQKPSEQKKNTKLLVENPNLSLDLICDCVIISSNLFPEAMEQFIEEREINDGFSTTTDSVKSANGEELKVYRTNKSLDKIDREKTTLILPNPKDFTLNNEYNKDQTITVYGLTLFTLANNQNASLQEAVSAINFW